MPTTTATTTTFTTRSLTSEPAPVPSARTGTGSHTLHLASWVVSPLYGVVVLLALVGLAVLGLTAAGMFLSSHPADAASPRADRAALIAPQPQSPVQPVGLMVRGQPMRWSQAESQAVQERAAGEPYDSNEYKAAMKAAQFNQKNGWSDDGTERLGSGTPLRNNQKRGGDSNDDPCLASFTLTAGICDDGGEDGFGEGDDGVGLDEGGIAFEDLGASTAIVTRI